MTQHDTCDVTDAYYRISKNAFCKVIFILKYAFYYYIQISSLTAQDCILKKMNYIKEPPLLSPAVLLPRYYL